MSSQTPEWKKSASVLTTVHKLNTTPSRNPNYIKGKVNEGDRYVCLRNDDQFELASHLLSNRMEDENINPLNTSTSCPTSPATKLEQHTKRQMMRVKSDNNINNALEGDRVCAFRKGLAPVARFGHRPQHANVLFSCVQPSSSCVKRSRRYIFKDPDRMLDAPNLLDDFYTNLIDWSKSNLVAVCLGKNVFQWNAATGVVEELKDFDEIEAHPTLVKWSREGQFVAVGFSDGQLKLIDSTSKRVLRTIKTSSMRIACASWTTKGCICCGSRTGQIYHHDVRLQNSLISTFSAHTSEVCGLKWSPDEQFLTSGGSDCLVNVWDRTQVSTLNAGGVSIVRELHVYGTAVPVDSRDPTKFQHQGFGQLLMEEAERIALEEHGSWKIAVISGVGTRHYYRKMGYELDGPYMSKILNKSDDVNRSEY